ncbi:MAG: KTSC domain-containing protein [Candidatus Gracilibacteria bacterium]|nr:KTSC domain-containing protein [Candidatus Gracilibacteria bacterium]
MERTSVISSNIASIGYDEESHILEVEFNNGSVYQYSGVPVNEYNNLMGADSHGTYLNQNIKPFYPFSKI